MSISCLKFQPAATTTLPTPQRSDYPETTHRDRDLPMSVPPSDAAPKVLVERHPTTDEKREDLSSEILNLPNSLTLFRIFLVPFLVVVLLTKFYGREYAGLAIFL